MQIVTCFDLKPGIFHIEMIITPQGPIALLTDAKRIKKGEVIGRFQIEALSFDDLDQMVMTIMRQVEEKSGIKLLQ